MASLERAGVSVVVKAPRLGGEVHLVAERTELFDGPEPPKRLELTFAEAAALRMMLDIFPDAELVAIRKQEPTPTILERAVRPPFEASEELKRRLARLDPATGVPKEDLPGRWQDANGRKP